MRGVGIVITTKIPINIPCSQVMNFIEQLIRYGAQSFELEIQSFGKNQLIIHTNDNVLEEYKQEEAPINLEILFAYVKENHSDIELVLNLIEPYLENRVKVLIDKWGLKKQVYYCGQVNPDYLTPWDRPYILYNIENCLPNVYALGDLKRAHFDVINYFCNKYKVKTIRLHARGLTADIICWASGLNLQLSIFGIESFEEAQRLEEAGVDRVTVSEYTVSDAMLVNE